MSQRSYTVVVAVWVLGFVVLPPLTAQAPSRFLAFETSLQGEDFGDLRWPIGVAVASTERLGVADAFGKRLVAFVLDKGAWNVERTVTLPSAPRALAHDGRRYVVSLSNGKLVSVEGDEFNVRGIALPLGTVAGVVAARARGGLLVHDPAGERVLILGEDDAVRGEVAVTSGLKALAASPDGGFYTALPALAEVRRHGPDGAVLRTWTVPKQGAVPAWPSGLFAAPGGDVVVVDRHSGKILAFDAAGRLVGIGAGRGWQPGQLLFPVAIAEFPDGNVLVADQGNSRVQIFRSVEQESRP